MRVFNREMPQMSKPMRNMLIIVAILFAVIFGYKMIKGFLINRYMITHQANVVYVSVTKANYSEWQPQYNASGSLRAVVGVNVTAELAGMIREIYFTPGAIVKKGDLLVLQDVDADVAQLHVAEANAELAKINLKRDTAQYAVKAISKATLDADEANVKTTQAQVEYQNAIIGQKTIRAPFSGRLGISAVNPGQYLNPGDKITMLQTLDPIYADFYVPQQSMEILKIGQPVTLSVDAFSNISFSGKITTIDPGVDPNVRNVQVEATIPNPDFKLVPGMFASVTVNFDKPQRYLTLPQTAITFNPYGATVYIVRETGKDKKGKPILTAKQAFVSTGAKRGDQIAVLKGVEPGDEVVTSGQLKLHNGSLVAINNSVIPTNEISPKPVDE